MSYELDIQSFRGHDINSATYVAMFATDEGNVFNGPGGATIEAPRPAASPVYVRTQPDGVRLTVDVQILELTTANLDQLKRWFSIYDGEGYLVANDAEANSRRILCAVERVQLLESNLLRAYLRSSSGLWEASTLEEGTEVITADGQTFNLVNGGTAPTYPKFTITPNTQMSHDDSYIHRRRVWIANRSPFEVGDPIGDGYPIDLGQDAFDTAALTTAKMLATGHDLRTVLAGEEIYRWLDGMDTSTTKVWCNLRFQPRKTFTIKAAMSSGSSPAAGERFTVSNPEGLAGWPENAFAFLEDEVLQLQKVDAFTWEVVRRGVGGTTAVSHIAGTTGYWIEHPWLDIIYDFTAAADPAPPDDRKPIISLASSTNGEHVWAGPFFNATDRRSRALQRRFTDGGFTANYIRCYEASDTLIFEDAAAVAGKPRFNNAEIDCPIPIDDASGAVELDFTVNRNLLLKGYGVDIEGNEAELISEQPQSAQTNQTYTPAQVLQRLRLLGRFGAVLGNRDESEVQSTSILNTSYTTYRFRLQAETQITGFDLKLHESAAGTGDILWDIWEDDGNGYPDFTKPMTEGAEQINNASVPSSMSWVAVDFAAPMVLPSGIYHLTLRKSPDSGTILAQYTDFKAKAEQWQLYNIVNTPPASGDIERARVPLFVLRTTETTPQADTPVSSGDKITLDNIELTYAAEYLPKIVMAPEEDMYLHNFTIRNNITGQWMRVFLPCRVGAESVYIDCETRQILDQESGLPVPFALVSSDSDWLRLSAGTNEIEWDEDGVTSVDVEWEFVERFL